MQEVYSILIVVKEFALGLFFLVLTALIIIEIIKDIKEKKNNG
jgi:hypothetical protein